MIAPPPPDAQREQVLVGLRRTRAALKPRARLALKPAREMPPHGLTCPSVPDDRGRNHVPGGDGDRPAGPCVASACANWVGHCSVGVAVAHGGHAVGDAGVDHGADCTIESSCRWRLENGPSACVLCDLMTHDPIDVVIARIRCVEPRD